ncbi:hypothetical protein AA958_26950 [Streptomyces sp. CNQ-509]|uniref:hypothetical protein n=1 Tax=unclassified Streptomyces TaxID=2593676 RepID=UPI00062DE279|nr:hypothetical protein [Streptomyces sp. CNQ-509]AKH85273.1 hypothetical protein AA958_26950 [Streptomyces sp. CNQ-509]
MAPTAGSGPAGPKTGILQRTRPDRRVRAALERVADAIVQTAPRVPVRDLATLRRQFPGLGPEEIADRLVAGAVKGSATVGAGIGAAAMMPAPPAMPAELAAEIVAVASIELKLIAELHEVYGVRAAGPARQRAMAYLGAWTDERGIDAAVLKGGISFDAVLGGPMRRRLRQQVLRRTVRNLPTLAPFLMGAAAGALMNRRDTGKLAERVRDDLRARQVPWDALTPAGGELAAPGNPGGRSGAGSTGTGLPKGDPRALPPGGR